METLAAAPYNGRADLPALAASLQLELDELLPLGETLHLLAFAELEEGDIRLTDAGPRLRRRRHRRPQSTNSPPRCACR
jgi:NitT/TauT family transport system ATP-binding protein